MRLFESVRDLWGPATDRRQSPWSGVVVVVQLPRTSQSLHFRAYSEILHGEPVLHWVARRLSCATDGVAQLRVMVDRWEERRAIAALGTDVPHASAWPTSGLTDLQDLVALLRDSGARRCLLVDPAAALLPPRLLERVHEVHVSQQADATYADRVPFVNSPLIVEAWLVRRLARLVAPTADLRLVLDGIRRGSASWLLRGVRVKCVLPLSSEDSATDWPYSVALASPTDIEVLAAVLGRAGDAGHSADLLRCWSDVLQERSQPPVGSVAAQGIGKTPSRADGRKLCTLFVSVPSAFSGAEQSLIVLADGLRKTHGERCRLAALVGQPGVFTDRLVAAGVEVLVARRDFSANSLENFLYSSDVLDRLRPSLVHANSVAGVPLRCAAERAGVPFVQHVRVSPVLQFAGQLNTASAVIAVSAFTKRCLVRLGVSAAKIHVVHNGMPPDFMTPAARAAGRALRSDCGIPEDAAVALLVARFEASKRHDVALNAMAKINQRGRRVHLLLAGEAIGRKDVPVLESIRRQVSSLKLSSRVSFLGFRTDMAAVYAAADVLVLPSEDDPFPRSILEGMASGLSIVASRSGGIPELVSDRESGLLVRPGDADDLASALEEMLADEGLRSRLIAAGTRRVECEFSVAHYVEGVLNVYNEVLGSPSQSADVPSFQSAV